jgi:hypothetical protein
MIANSTSLITRSAEILIVRKSSEPAFASHQVSRLHAARYKRFILISHEDLFIIAKVAVFSGVLVLTISATVVALQAVTIRV